MCTYTRIDTICPRCRRVVQSETKEGKCKAAKKGPISCGILNETYEKVEARIQCARCKKEDEEARNRSQPYFDYRKG